MNQSNFLYYEFSCGCKHSDNCTTRLGELVCVKHLKAVRVCTWFTCNVCGKPVSTTGKYITVCNRCKRLRINAKARAVALTKAKRIRKSEKQIKDQSRRVDCIYGTECVDKEVYTGKKFNCNKCSKFKER